MGILTSIRGIVPLEAAQGLPLGRPAFGATEGQLRYIAFAETHIDF